MTPDATQNAESAPDHTTTDSSARSRAITRPAWRSPLAWSIFLGVLAVGLVFDLWTKDLAFERVAGAPVVITRDDVLNADDLRTLIPPHEAVEVVPSVLEFTLVLNPGAVFGLGAGQRWLFIGVTCVAIAMGGWMFAAWTRAGAWVSHACLGLVLAGGLGNLYDRLVFACVRDFIHPLPGVRVGGVEIWPYVSNVADAFLIVGIVGLVVAMWRAPTEDDGRTANNGQTAGSSASAA